MRSPLGTVQSSPMLEHFADVLAERSGPCLSIYLPTGRRFPEKQQDPVRFRNLLLEVERTLTPLIGCAERATLLAPLQELANNERFWLHTQDGLAVLRSGDFYKVWKLQRTVPERAIVADSFHTKPLLRVMQSADRFEVLALSREHVRLFAGNRDALDEIELDPAVPRSLEIALGDQLTEETDVAADTERFFRIVDRAILEQHSKPSGLPLILAALTEHHAPFREVSHNAQLQAEGITGNPNAFSLDELRQKAWAAFEPPYLARLTRLVDEYGTGAAHALASDDPDIIAMAGLGGRIRTLLVDDDRVVPGRVNTDTGTVTYGTLDDPHMDDVLDDLAELTLRMGGEVVMVPSDRMPTQSGVAAIYRF